MRKPNLHSLIFNLAVLLLLGFLANSVSASAIGSSDHDHDQVENQIERQRRDLDYDDDDDNADADLDLDGSVDDNNYVYFPGDAEGDDDYYYDDDDDNSLGNVRADPVMISGCKAAGDEGSGGEDECEQIKDNMFPCQITACKDAIKPKICSFNYLDDEGICPAIQAGPALKNPPAPKGCTETSSGNCFERCQAYKTTIVQVLGQNYEFDRDVGKSYRCPITSKESGKMKTVCGCTNVARKKEDPEAEAEEDGGCAI